MRIAATSVLAVVLLAPAASAAPPSRSTAPAEWTEVALAEIAAHRTNPPRAARVLALLSAAMADASAAPPGLQQATVAAAAATVLSYLYPDRAAAFDELAGRTHPPIALAAGRRVGARAVDAARRDGSEAV